MLNQFQIDLSLQHFAKNVWKKIDRTVAQTVHTSSKKTVISDDFQEAEVLDVATYLLQCFERTGTSYGVYVKDYCMDTIKFTCLV